jgi:hypothetical protein
MNPSESVIDAASVTDDDWRELASRAGDRLQVTVLDERLRESFGIHVERVDALPAFHHPFAYAAAARGGARGCGRDRLFVPQQA